MRRVRFVLPIALLACGPAVIEETGETPPSFAGTPKPGVAFTSATSDSSGRFVTLPSASAALHRLALFDAADRSVVTVDAIPNVRSATFWDATRGVGLDAVTVTRLGSAAVASVVSYDLAARRVVFRKEIPDSPYDDVYGVTAANDRVVLSRAKTLVTLDASTGAYGGVFSSAGLGIRATIPVPAAQRLVVWTTGGVAVLRTADAGLECVLDGPYLQVPPGAEGAPSATAPVSAAVWGTRVFLGTPTVGAGSHLTVIDAAACAIAGIGQGGLSPVLGLDGAIVSLVDRYGASPDAPPLPESVTASPTRFHFVVTRADTLVQTFTAGADDLTSLAASPDAAFVLALGKTRIVGLDVQTQTVREVASFAQDPVLQLSPSADSRRFYGLRSKSIATFLVDAAADRVEPFPLPRSMTTLVGTSSFDGAVLESTDHPLALYDRSSKRLLEVALPPIVP